MRHVRLALVCAALLVGLALVPGASADAKERVGTRINLFGGGFQVFPAGQPFHFVHGWGLDQSNPETAQALGRFGFSLAVDGVEGRESFVEKFHVQVPGVGRVQARQWVYNFPEGMTGTHTFTGQWFGACEGLVLSGLAPGPCENPVELTTADPGPLTITVDFVP
jgi:hypothetical protein